jgi:hypothetical protein
MDEVEWLACNLASVMLEFLRGKVSDRKLRLAAVGCCRHVVYLCIDTGKTALEVAEGYADGFRSDAELVALREMLGPYTRHGPEYVPWLVTSKVAYDAAFEVAGAVPALAARAVEISIEASGPEFESNYGTAAQARSDAGAYCVSSLRCVFGNPFRPMTIIPAWLTSTVKQIAETIYEERAFDRMPILADALEDAGCTDATLLDHLRGPGPHVRGCFALDLVLGKS